MCVVKSVISKEVSSMETRPTSNLDYYTPKAMENQVLLYAKSDGKSGKKGAPPEE